MTTRDATTSVPHEFNVSMTSDPLYCVEWLADNSVCGKLRDDPIHQVSASTPAEPRTEMKVQTSNSGRRFVDIKDVVQSELSRIRHDRTNGAATNAAENWRIERARRQQSSAATTSEAVAPERFNAGTPPDTIWVHPWREVLYYKPETMPGYIEYTRVHDQRVAELEEALRNLGEQRWPNGEGEDKVWCWCKPKAYYCLDESQCVAAREKLEEGK